MLSRGVMALLCAALVAVALPNPPAAADEVYPIVFPVVGDNHFTDTYGAPRGGGRTHIGIDIMADKMTPVVAAADGTVGWMSGTCCSMQLHHDDGYESWYIHINNDTPGTDDGQAWGFVDGIEPGARVTAGELIGWVGDSGNAEGTNPHLHFELHNPSGPFNPYESLLAATHINPLAADEVFFYRSDGLFRYYDINPDATLGTPLASGDNYTSGWSTITAIDLDGDDEDEMFFYRDDGLFRYYNIRPDGSIPAPLTAGDDYTKGWDSITAIDLDGNGEDEMLFYRRDGLFRYYDVRSDGTIPRPTSAGDNYTQGWDAITAVDVDGDGQDEVFFYRNDGLYRFYDIRADGTIPKPMSAGTDLPAGWTTITAIDLNGDGQDEMLFYKDDGGFSFFRVGADGVLGELILSGADYTAGWGSIASVNLDG